MLMKEGLEPIIDHQSRILILGTLPGEKSLTKREYYADNRNQFWKILSCIFEEQIKQDYKSRREFLRRKGIALWDVLKAADREGSSDSSIDNPVFNDLEGLIKKYPSIKVIGVKGETARDIFWDEFSKNSVISSLQIEYIICSSAREKLEVKVNNWQKLFL